MLSTILNKKQEVIDAKNKELQNLVDNTVFEDIDDRGQKAVSCKWLIKEKEKPDGSKLLKGRGEAGKQTG